MADLISLEVEKHCLKGLLKYPNLFPDLDIYLTESSFTNSFHKTTFLTLKGFLLKNQKVDAVLLANAISNLGITHNQDIPVYDYVETLFGSNISEEATKESVQELVKLRILRDTRDSLKEAYNFIKDNKEKPVVEILENVDRIYHSQIKSIYALNNETKDIFLDLETVIEDIGNNPPDESKFMMGPFPTINRIWGSLHRKGNLTVVGSRSGVGKTSAGMFVNIYVAEKYNIPLIHLDAGEMSERELQFRAVCSLTHGKVPYWAVEQGKWRNNTEWTKLVREIWPRVKKIKFYYQDISGLDSLGITSLLRRIYYQKVGRNNDALVHYDYLKSLPPGNFNSPDWLLVGQHIQNLKSMITNEINIPIWASLQLNKLGVTNNRSSNDIIDDESAFGISDRILQQSSHSLLIRQKVMDELVSEDNKYGNMKVKFLKYRHLGVDFNDALIPVKISKGKYERNYVNLNNHSFFFEDKGDLKQMVKELDEKYDIENSDGKLEDSSL